LGLRLAHDAGRPEEVEAILAALSPEELHEWAVWYRLQDEQADERQAMFSAAAGRFRVSADKLRLLPPLPDDGAEPLGDDERTAQLLAAGFRQEPRGGKP